MLKRKEVKTYKIHLMCDKCGGEMFPTGQALMTHPVQYPHVCEVCEYCNNVYGERYPIIEYGEDEIDEG